VQHNKQRPRQTHTAFDYGGDKLLISNRVRVRLVFPAELCVLGQVILPAMMRAVDFLPPKAKLVLHVNGGLGVKHKVLVVMVPQVPSIYTKPLNIKIPNLFLVFKVKIIRILLSAK